MLGLTNWQCSNRQSARSSRLQMIWSALGVSAMLCSACVPGKVVIPDPNVPHQVAKETTVKIWVRTADGGMSAVPVRLLEGWWIASPQVMDPPK